MQTKSSGSGPPPLPVPADAAEASVTIGAVPFGVFRRALTPQGKAQFPRGFPTRGARPIDRVPLADVLTRPWDDDRHFVTYTSDRPFRVNNEAVGKVRVEARILAVDVDNHDHVPGWMEREGAKIAALLATHPGGFVHTTRHGWRALYALPLPFPIGSVADKEAFTRYYACVAAYLYEQFGIVSDPAMTSWNQPVRCPHVVREGRVFDAQILGGDPRALRAFDLPICLSGTPDLRPLAAVLDRWGMVAKRLEPRRSVFRVASATDFEGLPLPPRADRIAAAERWAREEAPRAILHQGGRATARSVAATLHVGFALPRDEVARILMGPYNQRRCSPPWSADELDDLHGIAYAVAHTPVQTPGFLLNQDRTGIEAARATLAAAGAARRRVPLEDVSARILAAVAEHQAVVIRATPGAGKSHTIAHAIASGTLAPTAGGRVIIVAPRHELARAWVQELAAAGETDVTYHASVVQRTDAHGRRHCDQKVALQLYKQGGDVAHDVCPSCPRKMECPAYNERQKPNARVHVLPREMVPKLNVTGEDLVVLDDSAVDLLAWHRLGRRQLQRLGGVDPQLLPSAQAPFLPIFAAALLAGPRAAEETARAGLVQASLAAPAGDALRFVASRLVEGQRSPHLPREVFSQGGDELRETLRDVGRVRGVLRFAAALAAGAEVHWSKEAQTVHGESEVAALLRAHPGRLVVLDGAANVEELRALRADLHIERLDVDDAGDTTRLLLFAKHATRTALVDPTRRRALLDRWLRAALAHLTARKSLRPVFVVYKALRAELRAHPALLEWCAANPKRSVRFGHFGGLRGSNRYKARDAVVTLGDPWLHGDDVLGRAEHLELDEPTYRVALATAELGQAHGRSRSVRRSRKLTHVHVGRLVPDGWGHDVVVDPLDGPPERLRGPAERLELSALVGTLGGNRQAAPLLGCHPSTLAGYRTGNRGMPAVILDRARSLAAKRSNQTASSGEAGARAAFEMDAPPCKRSPRGCVHLLAEEMGAGEGAFQGGEYPTEEAVCAVSEHVGPLLSEGSPPLPKQIQIPSVRDVPRSSCPEDVSVPAEEGEASFGGGGLKGPGASEGAASAGLGLVEGAWLALRGLQDVPGAEERLGVVREAPGVSEAGFGAGERSGVGDSPRREVLVAVRAQASPGVRGPSLPDAGAPSNASAGAVVLALLEHVSPSRAPPSPSALGPLRTFDNELALLREVQARARRKVGLGP
jgi:hypothetical protein